jgi:hypothetical protein
MAITIYKYLPLAKLKKNGNITNSHDLYPEKGPRHKNLFKPSLIYYTTVIPKFNRVTVLKNGKIFIG